LWKIEGTFLELCGTSTSTSTSTSTFNIKRASSEVLCRIAGKIRQWCVDCCRCPVCRCAMESSL
jgi:hypothetical protein